jgi:hypothetical protein
MQHVTNERISLIKPDDATGDTKVLYDAVDAMLGRVPADVTLNTARSRDDVYEQVALVFNEAEIVELTLMSSYETVAQTWPHSFPDPTSDPQAGET